MIWRVLIVVTLVACNGNAWRPGPGCGREGSACTTHGDCCSFACNHGTCECAPQGEHCLADSACCAGNICENEQCVEGSRGTGGDAGTCYVEGDVCGSTADCCTGTCIDHICQACASGACCGTAGATCNLDAQCCTGLICDALGTCNGCGEVGVICHENADCCAPRACAFGLCCALTGETCGSFQDCCDTQYGRCNEQRTCCLGTHGACSTDGECCSGKCTASGCAITPDGSPCSSTDDCDTAAGSICIPGAPSYCCRDTASACTAGTDCCSGTCGPDKLCQ